ncbi:hypothetical protein P879_01495 [Paragonimus westermani]|uniref:Uncharacterized protein n=1 Tax=Paragonimus westermani TaxID=34504 RepID=A0A8T0DDX1_9TREM|nr:hypothetical protein P879_01495 [Paragonimus westermani]
MIQKSLMSELQFVSELCNAITTAFFKSLVIGAYVSQRSPVDYYNVHLIPNSIHSRDPLLSSTHHNRTVIVFSNWYIKRNGRNDRNVMSPNTNETDCTVSD